MLRQILVAGVLMLAADAAVAENAAIGPITNSQQCFAAVDALAQTWENHKYANKADADKIGGALKQLEAQCEGEKYAEAQKLAGDLKTMIAR